MKNAVMAILMFTVFLASAVSSESSANTVRQKGHDENHLSDREAAMVNKLESLSEFEKREIMVYLSGKGATKAVEFAISEGYLSPDAISKYTLLTAAATHGRLETVNMLVAEGADIELKDGYNDTPLKAAAREGQLEIVNFLLSEGSDPNTEGKGGSTPLSSCLLYTSDAADE